MSEKRHTIQRDIVLQAVLSLGGHCSAEEVYALVAPAHPHISRATVYRNLRLLAQEGRIGRVLVPDAPDRYEAPQQPHYHVKCLRCGKLADVGMPYMETLAQGVFDAHGYQIQSHSIVFYGICPACQDNAKQQRKDG